MIEFGVKDIHYITLKEMKYKGVIVPKGFEFDGVTVKAPFTFLFSNRDLRRGIKASCFHDYMCKHKENYSRTFATDLLVELWKKNGLNPIKAWIVKESVNIYQLFKGGWLTK